MKKRVVNGAGCLQEWNLVNSPPPEEGKTDLSASDMPERLEIDKIFLLIQQAPAIHACIIIG